MIIEIPKRRNIIFYHNLATGNLPLLIRVHAACVNVSRNAFFNSRSEKKKFFFDVDIVVKTNGNVVYHGLYSYCQWVSIIILLPINFFLIASACWASLKKFLKGKYDAYKLLICIMQCVYFQVRVGVFNCNHLAGSDYSRIWCHSQPMRARGFL